MNEREALLRTILEAPDDDAPRLVFADWLEENGDPERAAFIRRQCEEEALPFGDPARIALLRRWVELLSRNRERWLTEIPEWAHTCGFRRGFPDWVALTVAQFDVDFAELWQVAPVRFVRIPDAFESTWRLGRSPHLSLLRGIVLGEPSLEEHISLPLGVPSVWGALNPILNSPHLTDLTYLHIGNVGMWSEDVRLITEAPHLAGLTHLKLDVGNRIGPEGAGHLARSPYLTRLEFLDLDGNEIGDEGAIALAGSPNFARLVVLSLRNNGISELGAEVLANSPNLAGVRVLHLTQPA